MVRAWVDCKHNYKQKMNEIIYKWCIKCCIKWCVYCSILNGYQIMAQLNLELNLSIWSRTALKAALVVELWSRRNRKNRKNRNSRNFSGCNGSWSALAPPADPRVDHPHPDRIPAWRTVISWTRSWSESSYEREESEWIGQLSGQINKINGNFGLATYQSMIMTMPK